MFLITLISMLLEHTLTSFPLTQPIYATLSDIVVYSPMGATPAAISLARRFRTAIRAKRLERLQAAGLGGEEDDDEDEVLDSATSANNDNNNRGNEDTQISEQEKLEREERRRRRAEFVKYNVFVLDATEDEMRKTMPHLMMRICGAGVPGGQTPHSKPGCSGAGCCSTSDKAVKGCQGSGCADQLGVGLDIGAHTDGPDGHTIELDVVEQAEKRKRERREATEGLVVGAGMDDMDMDRDPEQNDAMDVDADMPQEKGASSATLVGEKKGRPRQHRREQSQLKHQQHEEDEDDVHLVPNTVDFALREREEMRDLTKASEIISLHPLQSIASALSSSAVGFTPPAFSSPFYPAPSRSTRTSSSAMYEDPEKDGQAGWDPRVGQVYLGNSGDVPLAPEVPSHFRHAASVPRDVDEAAKWDWEALTSHLRGVDGLMKEYGLDEDELAPVPEEGSGSGLNSKQKLKTKADVSGILEEDPFNYLATNDPARGYGYDICVECHDLAPFPSTSHLRAADEHLGTLDVMWRERWEKAWLAREEKRVRREMEQNGEQLARGEIPSSRIRPPPPAPPRPPPHANAVIHLPFPSSPSNSQATMVALMPVIRFLEKWIQPVPPPLPAVQPTLVPTRPTTPSQTELKNLRMIENLDPKKAAAGTSPGPQTAPASPGSRRWSSVTALMPSLAAIPGLGHHKEQEHHQQQQQPAPPAPPPAAPLPPHPTRMRSMTTPSYQLIQPPTPVQTRTRPLKILLYSSDGYTESSVPALCLLMAIKALNLPEAYLELQVEKRRSFFVYQADLGILRRVEARLREEREREKEKERERERERERMAAGAYMAGLGAGHSSSIINANGKRTAPAPTPVPTSDPPASRIGGFFGSSPSSQSPTVIAFPPSSSPSRSSSFVGRPAAKSVSFAHGPPPVVSSASQYMQNTQHQPTPSLMVVPSLTSHTPNHHPLTSSDTWPSPAFAASAQLPGFPTSGQLQHAAAFGSGGVNAVFTTQQMSGVIKGRPRASTSPWLPSLFGGDHQSWFNDPRFDGSFPSRVLPFLYLGNLNHASNVYMLHALGITHVVSVGECALVPPPHHMSVHMGGAGYRPPGSSSGAHFVPGKGPGAHGSLWIEEREGRIKVLDIKGVCDDGIDTLEPQLEPICDWIDKARQDGGQVLVHCRVGVSRSATVTIAYVMKHLELPLVDAYLIVRSRRLSVLIQPNMRLLYNLCGWEIKLAKERANGDERKLKKELARTLTWPYLAKEVHALNEKYLH
ncbi:hypothetical protein CVT26_014508 [Gymnopilus dilepis]|uniref:Uncharacterized protein n=1 Tax=Gymnopilus dilepis TaxID=231916 RepID=A0A409W3C8_9AGAR|nr:hypothetical protein CVT26_014508 [Gymnopilus dilepis]